MDPGNNASNRGKPWEEMPAISEPGGSQCHAWGADDWAQVGDRQEKASMVERMKKPEELVKAHQLSQL